MTGVSIRPHRGHVPSLCAVAALSLLTHFSPAQAAVNRDSYLNFITSHYNQLRGYTLAIAGRTEYAEQHLFARREAFYYKVYGNTDYVRSALTLLRGTHAYWTVGPGASKTVDWETLLYTGQAWLWIKDCPVITNVDRQVARSLLLKLDRRLCLEYGAMNRSMGTATGRKIVSMLFPTEYDDASRRAYAQQVWDDWWTLRDNIENATPYNSLWWGYIDLWIGATGQNSLYQDPGFKALADRYFAQATPMGIFPSYGDTVGLNTNTEPGRWIALLEKWASVYHDGRYKWVAHRLFEWTTSREHDMDQWGGLSCWMMDALMDAWLACDDSIPEQKPAISSVVTSRKAMQYTSVTQPLPAGYYGKLVDRNIPDKLVLRSGWNLEDMYALVELAPRMGHGQGDTAAINYMTSRGSLLLADTSYQVKSYEFHNSFQLTRPGEKFDLTRMVNMQTTVPVMADGKLATYAQVHVDGYLGQPASLDRRIFFVKNMLMWVQDTLNVTQTFQAKVGPAWQTVALYPKRGSNWANTRLTTVPVSSIWDLNYLMQWTNIPWDLLVIFMPDSSARLQVDSVTYDNTRTTAPQLLLNNMNYRLWYLRDTTVQPGTPVRFNSVLMPHTPMENCTSLAGTFQLVVNTTLTNVEKIDLSSNRTLWLGMNDAGGLVQTGPLKTNARQFLVDIDTVKGVQYWIVGATVLSVNGQTLHSSSSRQTKEYVLP